MYRNRYIYDTLYGKIQFPSFFWDALLCPELQRLREVRLCNINSLCLPGGANINRYEHAIGTAYLATQCLESWPALINTDTYRRVVLAALLHDIGSTAFGHSVQYVLDREGYEHESFHSKIVLDRSLQQGSFIYQDAYLQPIYFGMLRRLEHLLSDEDLRVIDDLVAGRGAYGPIISGTMDLDNIDNVFRLAYHIGLTNSKTTPLALVRSIWINDGQLMINHDAISLLQEWYETRCTLYRYLLLNPDEFSAKCMLEEALETAGMNKENPFYWFDVDYEILQKLAAYPKTSQIISRLMLGDLYGCLNIYAVPWGNDISSFTDPVKRHGLEKAIQKKLESLDIPNLRSVDIAVHLIKDVNKTQRRIKVITSMDEEIIIGEASNRMLLGVFFKNVHLSMNHITQDFIMQNRLRSIVRFLLIEELNNHNVEELVLYSECNDN